MRWTLCLMLGLALLFTAACGGGTPAAATATPAPSAGQGGAPTQAAASSTTAPTVPPATLALPKGSPVTTLAGASDSLSLDSRSAGLDQLKSYRIRWQSQWTVTNITQTKTSSWDWTEEFSSNPEALHWNWKANDPSTPGQGGFEAWQIAKTTYMLTPDNSGKSSCASFSSDDKTSLLSKGLFSPKILGRISNASFVGIETVNGVPSKHYKYDQTSVTLSGSGKVAGEVWVAIDGGYVVRDVMQWQGSAAFLQSASSSAGDGKWTWDLTDANKPVTITLPQACSGSDLPLMPDAKDKVSAGSTVMYKTASTAAQVADFYQKAMTAAGWKQEGQPSGGGGMTQLTFTKGDKKVQILITSQGGQTNVVINSGP